MILLQGNLCLISSNENATLPDNLVHQELQFLSRSLRLWIFRALVIVRFVFLYLHALLVLLHLGSVILDGWWTSRAWHNITELLVLGICLDTVWPASEIRGQG